MAAVLLLGTGGARAQVPAPVEGLVLELAAEPGVPAERVLQVDGALHPTDATRPGPVTAVPDGSGYDVTGPAPATAEAVAAEDVVHRVTLLLYAPNGRAPDTTLAQARAALEEAGAYWREQSGGQVDLQVVRAVDWRTGTSTCAATTAFFNETAALAGFTPGRNEHLLVLVPRSLYDDRTCALGRATVGGSLSAGGYAHVVQPSWSDMAHELGHNLSLGHADALTCTSPSGDTPYPSLAGCVHDEYGDAFSAMASSGTHVGRGSLTAPHLHALGLGDGTPVVTGTGTQTVVLASLSQGDPAGSRYARVVDPGGDTYFLEYRSRVGRDAVLGQASSVEYGVRVLKAHPSSARTSVVLDPTPTGTRDRAEVLAVGTPWSGATGRVRVTVTAAVAASATVQVQTGAAPVAPTAALTAAVTAAAVPSGKPFSVVGALSRAGAAAKGVPVALQQRAADGTWTTLRTGRTSATGVVTLGGRAAASATVRLAVVPGAHGVPAVTSGDVPVRLSPGRPPAPVAPAAPVVSGHISTAEVVVGRAYAVVGRAVADGVGHRGVPLVLSTRPKGSTAAFTAVATQATSAAGLAVFTVKGAGAAQELRLSHAGGGEALLTSPVAYAPVTVVTVPTGSATSTVVLRTPSPSGARFRLETRPLDARGRPAGDWTARTTADGTVTDAVKGLTTVALPLPLGRSQVRAVRLDGTVRGATSEPVKVLRRS